MKRLKRRYLALQIDSNGLPSQKELLDAIWTAVIKLYGEVGASQTSLSLIEYDLERKLAVIRTAHATVNLVRTSLASITSIAGNEVSILILAVSGTIKALRKKFF